MRRIFSILRVILVVFIAPFALAGMVLIAIGLLPIILYQKVKGGSFLYPELGGKL